MKTNHPLIWLTIFCLSLTTAFSRSWAQDAHPPNLDALGDEIRRESIPHVPFPLVDPATGSVVEHDRKIRVMNPDGQMIEQEAGAYYATLNEYERRLNELGFTLRSTDDEQIVSRVPSDREKMTTQADQINASVKSVDTKIMVEPLSPGALSKALSSERGASVRSLNRLYAESSNSARELPEVEHGPFDPEVISTSSADLATFLTKSWGFTKGEKETFAVEGSFALALSGSMTAAEASAIAKADLYVFGSDHNLAQSIASARAGDGAKLRYALIMRGKVVYDKEYTSDTAEPTEQASSAADDVPAPSVSVENQYVFSLGPIPMVATIGASGNVDFDYTVGVDGMQANASAWFATSVEAFASVSADVAIVSIGVGSDLIILQNKVTLEGRAGKEVDPLTGEQIVVVGVRGENEMIALKGNLYAFAAVRVPPLFKKKEFRKSFYEYPGFVLDKTTLFNFGKVSSRKGVYLTGAPSALDYAELDLDNVLESTLRNVAAELGSEQTRSVLEGGQPLLEDLRELGHQPAQIRSTL